MISRELNVTQISTLKPQNNHTHSYMLINLRKRSKETFMEIHNMII